MFKEEALRNLDRWSRYGIVPPKAARISTDANGNTVLDKYGNAVGGVRSPYLDVPIAQYLSSIPESALYGQMKDFDSNLLKTLYPNHLSYVAKVAFSTANLVAQKWVSPENGKLIIQEAQKANVP